ncbi:carboxypeptidase regulatory-like domain-containing protein, partial [Anaerospora sp.]|uniref:carboxypeptidase regulatory-like domain-containing protein n=1 Tax=Anaerospora sp. TaxID=1960278 RepID=UPI0028974226
MIRKNSRVLVVALLILLSTIIPAFAAAAPTYTISGTVKDGSGKTLSGVKVTVGSKHYTTLMNGSYKIAGLAKTNQAISISLNGYVAASRNIKLVSDATHNFTLVKRDTIITK